jgi:hypothetical protein
VTGTAITYIGRNWYQCQFRSPTAVQWTGQLLYVFYGQMTNYCVLQENYPSVSIPN